MILLDPFLFSFFYLFFFFPCHCSRFCVSPCDAVAVAVGNPDPTQKMSLDELIQSDDSRHLSFDITAHSHLQCSAGSAEGDRRERENSFSAPTEGQVAAGGAAVVGRIGLLGRGNVKMTFFFYFFFFFDKEKVLSRRQGESHSSRAESNSCARYHPLCSCTRQAAAAAVAAAMTTSREPVTRSP